MDFALADKLVDMIADETRPLLMGLGYSIADLEFVKEGANWVLRYFIEFVDSDEPIDIDDCQRASEALSTWLDEQDPIPQAYFLEVSSPGIERELKKEADFIRFRGQMVQISTYKAVGGAKSHIGLLGVVTDENLTIDVDGQEQVFKRDFISKIQLHWDGQD